MEDVEHTQELVLVAKKVYSRLPRVGASNMNRGHIHGLYNEPENTVWDVYDNGGKKVGNLLPLPRYPFYWNQLVQWVGVLSFQRKLTNNNQLISSFSFSSRQDSAIPKPVANT
jgi:hypothetical protein